MLQPITFETERLKIHSFHITDIDNHTKLANDVLSLFSDPFTLKYVPEKRLVGIESAQDFVKTMIINHHIGRNHLHFITAKTLNQVIGTIDIITPAVVKEYYSLREYPYFIEFFLLQKFSGQKIMTETIPLLIDAIHTQGIEKIGAVVNRENIAAVSVLKNANFLYRGQFDIVQDLYLATSIQSQ
ncbi:GNAT family N-acetyltransferase [Taibaiella chishuiensis]|uniref:Acetyltransferase (GNAT) family protein n=1 Tax=Taibaiella chishuiensis TaxID=1434707 RepID=A0A2P8D0Z0_9BACT|nr:GNAT family protein [Taibaiella chishuiensis]PSK90826.1 acetyltransferase (GNAT) family protein [Taibaiella chishuiensis]